MADENAAGTANANAQGTPQPSFNLIGQYIRDMSFENPGAPGSIMLGGPNPSFNVGINVGKHAAHDKALTLARLPSHYGTFRTGDCG